MIDVLAYLAFCLLGMLFGLAFAADFWVDRKGSRVSSKVAGATNILVGFIPLITEKLGYNVPDGLTTAFFAFFGGTAVITVVTVSGYSQFTLIRAGKHAGSTCTWVDVLLRGYTDVKLEIDGLIRKRQVLIDSINESIVRKSPEAIATFLPRFADTILVRVPARFSSLISKEKSSPAELAAAFRTAASMMLLSIHAAIPVTYSRFSLRMYDEKTDQMICILCTDQYGNRPSPIKMSKPNMIMKSMEQRGTAIYSENKGAHQDTDAHTIVSKDRPFSEYVTQAIGSQQIAGVGKRPVFSVNMDVWPEYSLMLNYLAKTGIFLLIGKAIANLYDNEILTKVKDRLLTESTEKEQTDD